MESIIGRTFKPGVSCEHIWGAPARGGAVYDEEGVIVAIQQSCPLCGATCTREPVTDRRGRESWPIMEYASGAEAAAGVCQ